MERISICSASDAIGSELRHQAESDRQAMNDLIERLLQPVMLHSNAEQTNAERRAAAAEIEGLRAALYEVITNGEWTKGEQKGDWAVSKEVYDTARDAIDSLGTEYKFALVQSVSATFVPLADITAFELARAMTYIGQPIDRNAWDAIPLEVRRHFVANSSQ